MTSPLWIDFVNSEAHDPLGRVEPRDHLADPAWIRRFVAARGLPAFDTGSRTHRAALRDLRERLLRITANIVERGRLDAADLEAINGYLAARPVTSRLEMEDDGCRVRLTPVAKGIDAALFAIVESFASFLVEQDPERLKLCENPDCRWVFHDTTRSRTRRWCADSCGNLMKVRKFRNRKKTQRKKKNGRKGRSA